MNKTLNLQQSLLIFGLPLLVMLSMVALVQTDLFLHAPANLSTAITLDLLLTSPLLYLLLIRKTNISKTTVLPFFIAGLVIASFIIPEDQQTVLSQFKHFVLPVVELSVVVTIFIKVRQTVKEYKLKKKATPDFFSAIRMAAKEILPQRIVGPFITEIAVFYYCFVNWKKRPLQSNEFSIHKKSGMGMVLGVFIFVILVEAGAVHMMLHKMWSPTAAWILTGLSLYTALQVLGIIRSIPHRPLAIEDQQLVLRFGILSETTIPLEIIESVECSRKRIDKKDGAIKLSTLDDLESHNTIIYLKQEHVLEGFYGIKKRFKTIALHVDDKQAFKTSLDEAVKAIKK